MKTVKYAQSSLAYLQLNAINTNVVDRILTPNIQENLKEFVKTKVALPGLSFAWNWLP